MSNSSLQSSSSLPQIKNKLHVGENLMYQIHKKALQEYLKSGNIDQRIVSMNLLNVSQLKNEELDVLHKSLSAKNQKLEGDAGKILSKFRPKVKSNGLPLYFKKPDYSHEDQELNQLEDHLKIVLKSKLNTCKVFNGTYLVDPSISDLQRTNQKSKQPQQFIYFPAIKRKPSQANLRDGQQINQVVNQRLHDSELQCQQTYLKFINLLPRMFLFIKQNLKLILKISFKISLIIEDHINSLLSIIIKFIENTSIFGRSNFNLNRIQVLTKFA